MTSWRLSSTSSSDSDSVAPRHHCRRRRRLLSSKSQRHQRSKRTVAATAQLRCGACGVWGVGACGVWCVVCSKTGIGPSNTDEDVLMLFSALINALCRRYSSNACCKQCSVCFSWHCWEHAPAQRPQRRRVRRRAHAQDRPPNSADTSRSCTDRCVTTVCTLTLG